MKLRIQVIFTFSVGKFGCHIWLKIKKHYIADMVKQLLRTCFVVDTCKAKKNMFGLRNGGGKLFFTIRAEANFFFLINFNWNILINRCKKTKGSHTHFTNLEYNIPTENFFAFLACLEFFSYFWEFPGLPEKFLGISETIFGIPEGISWNPQSDLQKKSLKKKSFRLAEAGFSDYITQTEQLFWA